MNMESDKAAHILIDPLYETQPSEETGLNTHFGSTFAPRQHPPSPPTSAGARDRSSVEVRPQNTGSTTSTNPFRRSTNSTSSKHRSTVNSCEVPQQSHHSYPSPPNSASPRKARFSGHRAEAFGSLNGDRPRRSSNPTPSNPFQDTGITRGNSLRERYPGDTSHRPLEAVRKDTKAAHRAHHLRKKNYQGADTIDRLDKSTLAYHHEGPYDAANIARNTVWKHSPVAAVHDSNEEALRATPRENILDSVSRHRPLEGTANVPPGMPDRFGRVYDYEEGTDMQREHGGDYKRWPGVDYHKDDLKGKGEPSYTIEKSLKDHKRYGDTGTEMTSRRRGQSMTSADADAAPIQGDDGGAGIGRSNTTGRSVGNQLKKRFGSLRRRRAE